MTKPLSDAHIFLGYVFFILIITACSLIILGLLSFIRYRKKHDKEDLHAALVVGTGAVAILVLNMFYVFPILQFDSIRYTVYIHTNENTIMILPIPEEDDLIDNLELKRGECDWGIVDTEYGKGLQIIFNGSIKLYGKYITYSERVDYTSDLIENDCFRIYYEAEGKETRLNIDEFRVIHQDTSELLSKQLILYRYGLDTGWNLIKYETYP
jgi:hypothetical protein